MESRNDLDSGNKGKFEFLNKNLHPKDFFYQKRYRSEVFITNIVLIN